MLVFSGAAGTGVDARLLKTGDRASSGWRLEFAQRVRNANSIMSKRTKAAVERLEPDDPVLSDAHPRGPEHLGGAARQSIPD